MRRIAASAALLAFGMVCGGYWFRDVQPRSFLSLDQCADSCYRASDLAGLFASAGIQRVPALLPLVVRETNRCITIDHPFPVAPRHFVVFPKRDIKDIASVSVEDGPAVLECIEHLRWLVQRHGLARYRVETNGSGLQHVTYLHFHLLSEDLPNSSAR